MVFDITFNNISAISWWSVNSVLLVEEIRVHVPVASHWQTWSHNVDSKYTSPWTGFELTTLVVIGIDCTCQVVVNQTTIWSRPWQPLQILWPWAYSMKVIPETSLVAVNLTPVFLIAIWLWFHSITNLFLNKFNICGVISIQFDTTIRSWAGIFNKLMTFAWPYTFFIFSKVCWLVVL